MVVRGFEKKMATSLGLCASAYPHRVSYIGGYMKKYSKINILYLIHSVVGTWVCFIIFCNSGKIL
jgi:hypothetical protein